jgi:hypothetical protein
VSEEVTPALFDHALRVYEEMLKRSEKEPVYREAETEVDAMVGGEVDVYTGHLTRLFADLQIANPYYTKIVHILKAQNCVEQLRRGGGAAMSKWILKTPPTEETFKALMERKTAPKGKAAVLEQRVGDLMKLSNQLQDLLDGHELRIQVLERKVEALAR